MKPGARLGDPTGHGKPLGGSMGSPNVLIGGKPAWRAQVDFHACPMFAGIIPHVGGFIQMGSPTVRINGFPATRVGDQVIEQAGPPDPVVFGCPNVFIG